METKLLLLKLLKDLIPYIDGPYFLGDGGLLGIVREKDLLEHDNDLDLYLLPGTKIRIPDDSPLKYQKWYLCSKVYNSLYEKEKVNSWKEYLSFRRSTDCKGMNRCELMLESSRDYYNEKLTAFFTKPHLDIFYLIKNQDVYICPIWSKIITNLHFKISEIFPIRKNNELGFPVLVPNNPGSILKRQYGNDCLTVVKKDFKWT